MPQFVGYPVEKLRRSAQLRDEKKRAEDLFVWAREVRTKARETKWKRAERQYMGQHFEGADGTEQLVTANDRITVNMSFSTVNTITPYVTGNEPSFFIEPYLAPASRKSAAMLKAWLNRTWRHHTVNGQEHLETCASDSLMYGDGFMGIFWDITDSEEPAGVLEDDDTTSEAKVWVDRISPYDVWLDPYADGLHNARFACVRTPLPLAEVKKDDRYSFTSELSGNTLETDDTSDRTDGSAQRQQADDDRDDIVDLIEFYDIPRKKLIVFVVGQEFPLRVVEGINIPYYQLKNYRIPRSPYGMGELDQLWSLQQELNKTRSQMITHRRRNVAKYLARENQLAEGAVDALTSEEIGAIAYVKGNTPFDDILKPLEVSQLSADAYQVSDLITRDIYEISGVNEYLRGATPAVSRTATEATIIESASNVKSTHKLRLIEKFVRKIGQHILETAAAIFPETKANEFALVVTGRDAQALARANDDPDPATVEEVQMILTEDQFKGQYEVFVESGSTEMRNPRFREQRYLELLTTLSNVAPVMMSLGQTPPNLSKVVELLLESADIEDLDAIVGDPAAQQALEQKKAEDAAAEAASAAPGGRPTTPGGAEPRNAQAPTAPITSDNSGQLPPA